MEPPERRGECGAAACRDWSLRPGRSRTWRRPRRRVRCQTVQTGRETVRTARVGGCGRREPFCEDTPITLALGAEEPPGLDAQTNRGALPGQIRQQARITAVDAYGRGPAVRAGHRAAPRAHMDHQAPSVWGEAEQLQFFRSRGDRNRHRALPGRRTSRPVVPWPLTPASPKVRESRLSSAVDTDRVNVSSPALHGPFIRLRLPCVRGE